MDLTTSIAVRRARAALDVAAGDSPQHGARDFVRGLIARTVGVGDPAGYAARRWGEDSRIARVTKAAMTGTDTDDLKTQHEARAAFFAAVAEGSVIGRMDLARRVPFRTRCLAPGTASRGYWVGENKPIPLSKMVLAGVGLLPRKATALIAVTLESLSDPAAEGRVEDDLVRACSAALDEGFLDPAADGTGAAPQAVTNGASTISSLGNPADDLAALVENFAGDLDAAVIVTDPRTATQAALARDAVGNFTLTGLGPRGGSAIGLPVLTSRSSPAGQWALIDQGAIAVALEEIDLTRSTSASLLFSDDPELDSEPDLVNLFQSELAAFKAVIHANWLVTRSGAVTVVSGADYGMGSTA